MWRSTGSFDKKIVKIEEIFDFNYFYLFLEKLLIKAQLKQVVENSFYIYEIKAIAIK